MLVARGAASEPEEQQENLMETLLKGSSRQSAGLGADFMLVGRKSADFR